MAALFSPSEQSYTSVPLLSSSSQLRTDARTPFSYRDLNLSIGVSENTVGSAKLTIGTTEVWAGVRAEVEDCREGEEGGRVVVGVECAPTVSLPTPEFLPSLTSLLASLYSPLSLPAPLLSSLSILPYSKSWVLYLDVLLLSSTGGNILDASLIASRCALASVKLPRVRRVALDDGEGEGVGLELGITGLVKGGKGGKDTADYELVDPSANEDEGVRLEKWEEIPVGITMNLVNQLPFVDATLLEESSSDSLIIFCFNDKGELCGVKQLGEGEIELGRIGGLMLEAKRFAGDLITSLNQKLQDV